MISKCVDFIQLDWSQLYWLTTSLPSLRKRRFPLKISFVKRKLCVLFLFLHPPYSCFIVLFYYSFYLLCLFFFLYFFFFSNLLFYDSYYFLHLIDCFLLYSSTILIMVFYLCFCFQLYTLQWLSFRVNWSIDCSVQGNGQFGYFFGFLWWMSSGFDIIFLQMICDNLVLMYLAFKSGSKPVH